jgi:hypothetical protein
MLEEGDGKGRRPEATAGVGRRSEDDGNDQESQGTGGSCATARSLGRRLVLLAYRFVRFQGNTELGTSELANDRNAPGECGDGIELGFHTHIPHASKQRN